MKLGDRRIGFIGFGHMAQAICRRIEQAKLIPRSQILFLRRDTHKMKENEQTFGITSSSLKNLIAQSDLLILGIRPHQTAHLLEEMAPFPLQDKLVMTLVTGVPLSAYQKSLGEVAIARVMPNIASAVGEGMSVLSFGSHVSLEFRSLSKLLFSALGEVMEVKEELMDIACAIAGSGPGFVFQLIESVAREGEKQGLSYEEALKMGAQAFAGAARLILEGEKPETLLHQISTPNGTTEAGLQVMRETHMGRHFQKVIEASAARSKELGQSSHK